MDKQMEMVLERRDASDTVFSAGVAEGTRMATGETPPEKTATGPVAGHAGFFQNVEIVPGASRFLDISLNLICVTVYNEGVAAVAGTIASLLESLQHARHANLRGSGDSGIALILDGPEKTDPQLMRFLQEAGLLPAEPNQGNDCTRFYFARRAARALPWHIADGVRPCDDLEEIAFVVCVKDRNHGKLHSHALFFGSLCARLNPRYCYQIDAGTTVETPALGAMAAHFEHHRAAGAIASRVISPTPRLGDGVLASWQFMDFATQQSVFWPAEVATGYLSVIPGQFCAFRWEALAGQEAQKAFLCEGDIAAAAKDGEGPVATYLRGLDDVTPVRRVMYLAEDRIIGNTITLGNRPWSLDYCPEARATTDACADFGELLRQRRRWNNSSSACRLWLIAQWPGYLRRQDRSIAGKCRFSAAMLWQLLLSVQQFLAPATLACMAMLLGSAVRVSLQHSGATLPAAMAACAAVAVLLLPRTRGRWQGPARAASFLLLFALQTRILADLLSPGAMVLLLAPLAASMLLTCARFPRDCAAVVLRTCEYVLVVNPVIQLLLWSYAVIRLDDVSWGTKGLTAHGSADAAMRRLRNRVILAWLLGNAAVIWAGATLPGLVFKELGLVTESLLVLFALSVFAATLAWGSRSVRRVLGKDPVSLGPLVPIMRSQKAP